MLLLTRIPGTDASAPPVRGWSQENESEDTTVRRSVTALCSGGSPQRDRPAGFLAARNGTHPLPDGQRRANGPVSTNAKLSQIDAPPWFRSGDPLADGPPSKTDGGGS